MRSEVNFFIPAGCLLRTNNSIPGSPDGIIASVVSSFGLAACAGAFIRKVPAARHAHENARHESEGIVQLPLSFLEPPEAATAVVAIRIDRTRATGLRATTALAC